MMNDKKFPVETDVLNKLAHDLMNPMTVVLGYAQLLAARQDLPDEARQQAEDIYQQALESATIVEKIKKVVSGRNQAGNANILLVDPTDRIFKSIKEMVDSQSMQSVKDLDAAIGFLSDNGVDFLVLDVDAIPVDTAESVLMGVDPDVGRKMVLVTAKSADAENLRSMGYLVLSFPFQESEVLEYLGDK